MYCKYCGYKNDDDSKFCIKCGKEITKFQENKITNFINTKFSKITGVENYKTRIAELEKMIDDIHENKISIESTIYNNFKLEHEKLRNENKILEEKNKYLKDLLNSLENSVLDIEYDIYSYDDINSEECKNQLSLLTIDEKEMIKNEKAVLNTSPEFKTLSKKTYANNKKQILNLFNCESELIIDNVSVTNIDQSRVKLNRIFEQNNKIFETDFIKISKEFLDIKLKKLTLVYTYQKKKKDELEQQKEIRQQLIEEEKVRREIEKEKQRIEKEEKQFNTEINKLMQYMQKSNNDIEKQLYITKINELEEKIKLLAKDKENVANREKNTRAGFVYIISNIGSFGENIYKIGMTRRLEPMERIKELSDASVPFEFDVHAMIFSEDAPALENLLHQHFEKNRVNKINQRKEFYKVDLKDIENLVKEKFNPTTEFVMLPKAEEYKQSK